MRDPETGLPLASALGTPSATKVVTVAALWNKKGTLAVCRQLTDEEGKVMLTWHSGSPLTQAWQICERTSRKVGTKITYTYTPVEIDGSTFILSSDTTVTQVIDAAPGARTYAVRPVLVEGDEVVDIGTISAVKAVTVKELWKSAPVITSLAQVDGVGRIVTNFVGQMNASLNQQFLELGRTLTDMNQNQQGALEKVTQSLATAHAMLEDVNRLQGVSQDVMAHFEGYVRELGENRRRDERFEQSSAELLERMRQSADAQAAALQKMKGYQDELTRALSQFQQQSYDSMTGMRKLSEDTAARLSGVGKTMQDSGRELKESYQSFVQNVVEGLSRSLGMFDQSMNSLITALGEKIDSAAALGTDGATAEQMSEIQRLLSSMQETLRQAADSLGGKKEA